MVLVGGTPCFINQTDWSYGVDVRDFNNFANNLFKNYKSTMINFYILQLMHSKNSKLIIKKLKEMEAVENPPEIKSLQLGLDILLNNDLRNDINKIKHQTLLITGDMDRLTPKSASMWLESHLKESQLKLIKGASHIPFLSHSDEFFNCLRSIFISSLIMTKDHINKKRAQAAFNKASVSYEEAAVLQKHVLGEMFLRLKLLKINPEIIS